MFLFEFHNDMILWLIPTLILSDVFWFSRAFLGLLRAALLREVSILVASLIAFSNSN